MLRKLCIPFRLLVRISRFTTNEPDLKFWKGKPSIFSISDKSLGQIIDSTGFVIIDYPESRKKEVLKMMIERNCRTCSIECAQEEREGNPETLLEENKEEELLTLSKEAPYNA